MFISHDKWNINTTSKLIELQPIIKRWFTPIDVRIGHAYLTHRSVLRVVDQVRYSTPTNKKSESACHMISQQDLSFICYLNYVDMSFGGAQNMHTSEGNIFHLTRLLNCLETLIM